MPRKLARDAYGKKIAPDAEDEDGALYSDGFKPLPMGEPNEKYRAEVRDKRNNDAVRALLGLDERLA